MSRMSFDLLLFSLFERHIQRHETFCSEILYSFQSDSEQIYRNSNEGISLLYLTFSSFNSHSNVMSQDVLSIWYLKKLTSKQNKNVSSRSKLRKYQNTHRLQLIAASIYVAFVVCNPVRLLQFSRI